jgi:glycosyltransferase involved in cell wall biosynthesis
VIVVSDGHDGKTTELCARQTWQIPLKFLEVTKSQQGIARNRGVEEAQGKYVFFIGDDIFLEPTACSTHLQTHEMLESREPGSRNAVLGFITWDPTARITPVMRWLEESGWQFGYPMLREYAHDFLPRSMQEDFSYTSHISLPTDIARAHPFREDVSLYGWEDIEWGMRLRGHGVRILFEPDAKAFHHHHLDLDDSLRRMEVIGQSLVHMAKVVPEFRQKVSLPRLLALHVLSLIPTMSGLHRRALLKGIAAAQGQRGISSTPRST